MDDKLQHIIESLPEETILNILSRFGAEEYSRTSRHIWFNTICHGGDSHKLCYNRDTKIFYCYTRCGSMSLFELIQKLRECTFSQAVHYLQSFVGFTPSLGLPQRDSGLSTLRRSSRLRNKENVSESLVASYKDTHVLELYASDVFYIGWRQEGISAEVMQRFNIRWDELHKAIIIPHYDIDGNLIGIRRRSLMPYAAKYMPLMLNGVSYAHPLGSNLYGIFQSKQTIRSTKTAIIFEGEKSVLKHHTMYGNSNAVAVCGFNVTKRQRELLLSQGIEEVILAFDKEVDMSNTRSGEYKRYCDKVNNLGRMFAPYCRTYALVDEEGLLDLKDAPIDKGKEVFECLLRQKVLIQN